MKFKFTIITLFLMAFSLSSYAQKDVSEKSTEAIKEFKPDVVICGHIHEGGGLVENIDGVKVMNVSMTPTIFEI